MLNIFLPLVQQALRDPREAAQTVLSLGVPRQALWPMFALMVVLSVLLVSLGDVIGLSQEGPSLPPLTMVVISAVTGLVSIVAVWRIGNAMGGTGELEEALLLTVFLQAIIFTGQLVEMLLMILLPMLGIVFSVGLIIFAVWLNINFIAALHGFSSLWRSFGVLLLSSLVAFAFLLMVMPFLGISMMGAP